MPKCAVAVIEAKEVPSSAEAHLSKSAFECGLILIDPRSGGIAGRSSPLSAF